MADLGQRDVGLVVGRRLERHGIVVLGGRVHSEVASYDAPWSDGFGTIPE